MYRNYDTGGENRVHAIRHGRADPVVAAYTPINGAYTQA
jgi:hypothetical protein